MNAQENPNIQKRRFQASLETDKTMQTTRDWIETFNPQKLLGVGGPQQDRTGQMPQIMNDYLDMAAELMKNSASVIKARQEDAMMQWEELRAGPPPTPSFDTPLAGVRHPVGAPVDGSPRDPSTSETSVRKS